MPDTPTTPNWAVEWDKDGERLYETGVDRVVLFLKEASGYGEGEGWNGVTKIDEKPSGAEATKLYANNGKYLNLISAEEYGASIEAYTYPKKFNACMGLAEPVPGLFVAQQNRKKFGYVYRTLLGNDVLGDAYGYRIHFVYGCDAAPSEKSNETVNESPNPGQLSWEISTTPVAVPGHKPTAHLYVDSTAVSAETLAAIEAIIYGTAASGNDPEAVGYVAAVPARLPLPAELITMLTPASSG